MGVPGIIKHIGKGERIALSKLAVEYLETHRRPLRIAIDVAIWDFQAQASQGGANAPVRNFYFRLLRLLALPIEPLFVYDGPNKPCVKRNKPITGVYSSATTEACKKLLQLFRFPYLTAPGEAEAECAALQKAGIVDAVMSQDSDTIMFGSSMTIKDWSSDGLRSKSPTHVNVLRTDQTGQIRGLDSAGMILVALLDGGDYDTEGLPGFGPGTSCEIAQAGFGKDLLEAKAKETEDPVAIAEWRQRLEYELEYNESGFFKRKHKTLKIPKEFPNDNVFGFYVNPTVSSGTQLRHIAKEVNTEWKAVIDVLAVREFVAHTFNWKFKSGARKFMKSFCSPLIAHQLWRKQEEARPHVQAVLQRRKHYESDAMPELQVQIVAARVVGIDLAQEEDNVAFLDQEAGDGDGELEVDDEVDLDDSTPLVQTKDFGPPLSPRKPRKSPPYDPTQPQNIWLPETIVKLGVPLLVEDWEDVQRTNQHDPIRFATRKCAPKKSARPVDKSMKHGALNGFFKPSKQGVSSIPLCASKENTILSNGESENSQNDRPNTAQIRQPLHSRNPATQLLPKSTSSRPRPKQPTNSVPSKLDRNVNPFTIAQRPSIPKSASSTDFPLPLLRSSQTALRPPAKRPSAEPESVASNPTARQRATTPISEPPIYVSSSPPPSTVKFSHCPPSPPFPQSSELERPRTRARKKTFQRAHTDPTNLVTGSVGPISPPPSSQIPLSSQIDGNDWTLASQARPTMLKVPSHRNVVSRDSLPGHWVDVELEDGDALDKGLGKSNAERFVAKRPARVSYLDMTLL